MTRRRKVNYIIYNVTKLVHRDTAPCLNTTMSTTSTVDDDNPQLTSSATFFHTSESLCYTATHVFLPVKPPDKNDYTPENDHSLARAVSSAAHVYASYISGTTEEAHWGRIAKMLDNLQASLQSEHLDYDHVISQLRRMQTGGTLSGSLQICIDNLQMSSRFPSDIKMQRFFSQSGRTLR